MPEGKIEFIGYGFNIHSVAGTDPVSIQAKYVAPAFDGEPGALDRIVTPLGGLSHSFKSHFATRVSNRQFESGAI